jgi:hypothetical protein
VPTTYAEIQSALNQTRFQKAVLVHIVEHLDADFMPLLDHQPKKVLLTEPDRVRVPKESFDVVIEALNNWVKSLNAQEQAILNSSITVEAPKQEPAAQPEQVTPTEEAQS